VKLCLVSVFPDIVKDCPMMRNLPKIFLKSFENVGPGTIHSLSRHNNRILSWSTTTRHNHHMIGQSLTQNINQTCNETVLAHVIVYMWTYRKHIHRHTYTQMKLITMSKHW